MWSQARGRPDRAVVSIGQTVVQPRARAYCSADGRHPVRVRLSGAEHPDTLTVRANLAYWTEEADSM